MIGSRTKNQFEAVNGAGKSMSPIFSSSSTGKAHIPAFMNKSNNINGDIEMQYPITPATNGQNRQERDSNEDLNNSSNNIDTLMSFQQRLLQDKGHRYSLTRSVSTTSCTSERDNDESTIMGDDSVCFAEVKPYIRFITYYIVFSVVVMIIYATCLLLIELNDYSLYQHIVQFTQWVVTEQPYYGVYLSLLLLALFILYSQVTSTQCSMRLQHYDQLD